MGTGTDIELVLIGPLVGTGNDVDHPADGVRAVDGGSWAADILDPLYLIEWQVVQFGHPGGQGGTACLIHQHQRLGRGTATHPQQAQLATAAIADNLDPGDPGKGLDHIGNGLGLQAIDLVPGNYIDRG